MRHMRFWLTGTYPGDTITGIRGQVVDSDQLYEITQKDGKWSCWRWVTHITDDGWGYQQVPAADDLFSCMAAAENDAKAAQEAMDEAAWEDEEDYR